MPSQLGVGHWRARVAEVRAEAAKVQHPTAKLTLLSIAENYEQLAEQAAAQIASRSGTAAL